MAVIFVEGFDYYNGLTAVTATTDGMLAKWYDGNGSGSLVAGRFGGQALNSTNVNGAFYGDVGAFYNSGCVGFASYVSGGSNDTTYNLFGLSTGIAFSALSTISSVQFTISINAAGNIEVQRGTTILGTSTAVVPFNVWNYIEIEFVISDTVGEVRVYLNNDPTPVINLSGVDNKQQTTAGYRYIALSNGNPAIGSLNYFDDLYVTDTPTRLGEQRVVTSYPNGNVLTDFWTSSTGGASQYTMVDETLGDADVTYISSSTTNSRAVFTVASLSVPPTTINAVQINGFARKTDTQFRQVALEYQNSVGSVATGNTYTMNTSYQYMGYLLSQNPLTGNPWSAAEVNSMRVGARLVT